MQKSLTMGSQKITITAENLFTIPEAAKELGVHFVTLYRWINKGKVHPFRLAGQVFITTDDVEALKNEKNQNG